ncbi:hypothetical protein C8F04DRAFT_1266790 [Mycena alexandri]|uniref:Uncharacterized protein n=1 Tax=Mycena alexandri TaxID=1745969 RepID=A0AAD6WY50_9AGAR|nr:hypothetical protein C8F04DRAFT_1266790 [Mycena alexandri]
MSAHMSGGSDAEPAYKVRDVYVADRVVEPEHEDQGRSVQATQAATYCSRLPQEHKHRRRCSDLRVTFTFKQLGGTLSRALGAVYRAGSWLEKSSTTVLHFFAKAVESLTGLQIFALARSEFLSLFSLSQRRVQRITIFPHPRPSDSDTMIVAPTRDLESLNSVRARASLCSVSNRRPGMHSVHFGLDVPANLNSQSPSGDAFTTTRRPAPLQELADFHFHWNNNNKIKRKRKPSTTVLHIFAKAAELFNRISDFRLARSDANQQITILRLIRPAIYQ